MQTCTDEIYRCVTSVSIGPPGNSGGSDNLTRSILNVVAWGVAGYLTGGVYPAFVSGGAAVVGELVGNESEDNRQPIGISENADLRYGTSIETLLQPFKDLGLGPPYDSSEDYEQTLYLGSDSMNIQRLTDIVLQRSNAHLRNLTQDERKVLYEVLSAEYTSPEANQVKDNLLSNRLQHKRDLPC